MVASKDLKTFSVHILFLAALKESSGKINEATLSILLLVCLIK
jgi:hypothetical protein